MVLKVTITGTVQGVGFRPFVYRVARELGLRGFVRNAGGVVEVAVADDGEHGAVRIERFVDELRRNAPSLAVIDEVDVRQWCESGIDDSFSEFRILHSETRDVEFQTVPADAATCADCLRELNDVGNRRFEYAFTNCTNCGPRYTIIKALPYDRHSTTMAPFEMCEQCRGEFEDPGDRRFHAQPNACADCGPRLWFETNGSEVQEDPIGSAIGMLHSGGIIAIKGLGGFHVACDALNDEAIMLLRSRKQRDDKPFAVMFRDLESVSRYAIVDAHARELLCGARRPIVLLRRTDAQGMPAALTKGIDTIGVMLPYTPLHHVLMKRFGELPLVMTSGNLSDEPICISNHEARSRLSGIADGFLLHDREIETRFDDSVMRLMGDARPVMIRRSRGYAPDVIRLDGRLSNEIIAFGAQLKNTFCFGKNERAFMSQHIGDLDDVASSEFFGDTRDKFEFLFRLSPKAVVHDLHPGYLSAALAQEFAAQHGLPLVGIQHHHAHIVSCMVDNKISGSEQVIGIALDGTGYGDDGTIWGGEFLISRLDSYERVSHFAHVQMPGLDAAVKSPPRMLAGYSRLLPDGSYERDYVESALDGLLNAQQRKVIEQQLERNVNTCLTSSCGRLFDAVSALLGICSTPTFEGQAAMLLESAANAALRDHALKIVGADLPVRPHLDAIDLGMSTVDGAEILAEVVRRRLSKKQSVQSVALYFHQILAGAVQSVALGIARKRGLRKVCLSGGVFQNALITSMLVNGLRRHGLEVFLQQQVPPNDGGLSLGQLVAGAAKLGWWENS